MNNLAGGAWRGLEERRGFLGKFLGAFNQEVFSCAVHSVFVGGGRVIFDPNFFCPFFAFFELFIHISFRENKFGTVYVEKKSQNWARKVLKLPILHCKNGWAQFLRRTFSHHLKIGFVAFKMSV